MYHITNFLYIKGKNIYILGICNQQNTSRFTIYPQMLSKKKKPIKGEFKYKHKVFIESLWISPMFLERFIKIQ